MDGPQFAYVKERGKQITETDADAVEIGAKADAKLADEVDAAQKRGELATQRDGDRHSKKESLKPTFADAGLDAKAVHEARAVRDAERAQPVVIRKTLDERPALFRNPLSGPQRVFPIARLVFSKRRRREAAWPSNCSPPSWGLILICARQGPSIRSALQKREW
jgi:hypothetical protein